MSSRQPKFLATKPLSEYRYIELFEALKSHRVQWEHLNRLSLLDYSEIVYPTGKINSKTRLPCYREVPASRYDNEFRDLVRRHADYAPIKPNPKCFRIAQRTRSAAVNKERRATLDIGCNSILEDDMRQDSRNVLFVDASQDDKERQRRDNLLNGKKPMPSRSEKLKKRWAFIDSYPDSDEGEEDCEMDEENLCEGCFPTEYAAAKLNTKQLEDDIAITNTRESGIDVQFESGTNSCESESSGIIDSEIDHSHDSSSTHYVRDATITSKSKPIPDVKLNVDSKSDDSDESDSQVVEPPAKRIKRDNVNGCVPQHRCCKGRRGCHSEHDEESISSSHMRSLEEIVNEFCEKTPKAKMQGGELKQLHEQLVKKQHKHVMAYQHLSKCCETMFCKTKPHGRVYYHNLRIKPQSQTK